MALQWRFVPQPETGKQVPKWMRSAAIDDDGTVFVAAAMAGNAQASFLSACFDGVPVVQDRWGHVYLPTSWMAQEYSSWSEVFASIERRMREPVAS
jgi:hypothetical protein